ncbi:G-type lectin S-receptor-like serine/threonine-protein kinase At1g11410 [Pistacia vera]|uniref:G-type lectin S-receptor-like serine/threonine-protein kinase At1g11410 n=1 Tax=Pistacia vera TaxID=55513 RepID=UPI0012630858|nr:G-type lectin S-receptor-like serine/threonine-protein kinase At1g11410 [Pistacia vera]
MVTVTWLLRTLLVFHLLHLSTSVDTITSTQSIKDGDEIVSIGKIFALGFFSPGNSMKRYVGIWYYQVSEPTIVWVANRDNPVNDTSGILSINTHGNLALFGSNETVPVWSTNIPVTSAKNTVAHLLDSGNLILLRNDTKKLLWQSFDYPTQTLLPFMKLGLNRRTGLNRELTAWKSADDPGTGNFSYRIDPTGFPQLSLYKGTTKWWRSGSWTGQRWSGVPEMTSNYIFNVTFVNNQDEASIVYTVTKPSVTTRMIVNESGFVQRFTWSNADRRWIGFWSSPKEQCDYYGHCGASGNCDPYHADKFECTCLPGFEPKSPDEWYLRDGSGGCKRKREMSTCQKGEGFVKVARVKIPDTNVTRVEMSYDLKACEEECLKNCSCLGYTSAYGESKGGIGCLTYYRDLIDTRTYANAGQDMYVRVDAAELGICLFSTTYLLYYLFILPTACKDFFHSL